MILPTFLLNNCTQPTLQEQQPFLKIALCHLKIDSAKTTNQTRHLHLVTHVDQVSPAIWWLFLKILTWHSKFCHQSDIFSFSICQCSAIKQVQLFWKFTASSSLMISLIWSSIQNSAKNIHNSYWWLLLLYWNSNTQFQLLI